MAVPNRIVYCPDALERLDWLYARGYQPLDETALLHSVRTGNEAVIKALLSNGFRPSSSEAGKAAEANYVDVLALLHDHGWVEQPCPESVSSAALWAGHLGVLQWADANLPWRGEDGRRWNTSHLETAARTGRLGPLAWLRERGCRWSPDVLCALAWSGCEAAVEWAVAHGCRASADGAPFIFAAFRHDFAMLRCLQRLGCPWGPAGRVFAHCITCNLPLPALRWLLEAGCPVDWRQAVDAATGSSDDRSGGVSPWLPYERGLVDWWDPNEVTPHTGSRSPPEVLAWLASEAEQRRLRRPPEPEPHSPEERRRLKRERRKERKEKKVLQEPALVSAKQKKKHGGRKQRF